MNTSDTASTGAARRLIVVILIGLGVASFLNIVQEVMRPGPTRALYVRTGDIVALAGTESSDVGTRFSFASTLGRVAPNAVLMVPEGIPIDQRQLNGLAGISVERAEYERFVDEGQLLEVDGINIRGGVGRLQFEDEPTEFVILWIDDGGPPTTMWLLPGPDRILVVDDRALARLPNA